MSAEPCTELPWDSAFFGCRIARVVSSSLRPADLPAVEAWCRARTIDCLYLLAADRSSEADEWRARHGFGLFDTRLTLERPTAPSEEDASRVRPADGADIGPLRTIASLSHRGTRFDLDPRFHAAAPRFYAQWIEGSVRDASVAVLVPAGSAPTGYITCRAAGEGLGEIGLLGVAPAARGAGLGRRLVNAALDWCARKGLQRVRVVTQGGNPSAVAFYRRCGFAALRTEWWYHRWFTDVSAR